MVEDEEMTKGISEILVTGGAGFIGSHIVDHLLKEGFGVTVLDNLRSGKMKNISVHQKNKAFRFVNGDIRNADTVKQVMKGVDAVFHEAAFVSIPDSVKDPVLANDINVSGTMNLLKAASDLGVKRFVYASSAAVYGGTRNPKKKEDEVSNPRSPYGISKLVGEYYTRYFYEFHGLETVSLRCFNVYGPRQACDLQAQYGGVITLFLNRLLRDMPPIIYGDGEQTRDFVYVRDVVKANMLAMTCKNAAGESFNIASGTRVTINKLAEVVKETVNKRGIRNTYTVPRPGDARHSYADTSKATRILNFAPSFSLEEGISELAKWYVEDQKP
jgi:nucleoside-diphosphate-sugar epimerase